MKYGLSKNSIVLIVLMMTAGVRSLGQAPAFVHPGIDQTAQDLAFMKAKVQKGEQPWAAAFERLKAAADTSFTITPYTHVLRGPYGKPNIGGNDLSKCASMAYNYALVWYITNDKKYAQKAIDIINAWSPVLQHFDYNDAKLLAAWTGHMLCNAAELLRYTPSGWQQKDIEAFTTMLMQVYYPLLRFYYPQANGNWDGAIIHSILAIGIFTNNRAMFDNAVDHFLHAPVNGSLLKYVFPSGQCQESMRDQGHVQLGLGEFAGAAQVAYTQGVDLFAVADNRLALGYEYTAQFLLGETPYCYGGPISPRAKELRDDYEVVYRHYVAQGIELPYTAKAADAVRAKASRSVLTAIRMNTGKTVGRKDPPKISNIAHVAGAGADNAVRRSGNATMVEPGQSLQEALDKVAANGGWVIAKAGIHKFAAPLKMPSGVTLAGEGTGTVLFLDPAAGNRETIVNATDDMHDVTIRDLVIEGNVKTEIAADPNSNRSYKGGYNRGGILFRTTGAGKMKNIQLVNLTVQYSTYNGVFINGATGVTIDRCDLNENGQSVPPGAHLLHNLLLTHCTDVKVTNSRLVTSPLGSGVAVEECKNVSITSCEIARNGYYGIDVAESELVTIKNNLIEGNDRSGVMVEYIRKGCARVLVSKNTIHYNNGYGVESCAAQQVQAVQNTYKGNGNRAEQQKLSPAKVILME